MANVRNQHLVVYSSKDERGGVLLLLGDRVDDAKA